MASTTRTVASDDDVVAIPLRHPGRWIAAAAIVVVLGLLFTSLWRNPNVDHPSITEFLFDPRILKGVWLTIVITAVSMVVGTILAVTLAIMRMSSNPVLRAVAFGYTWFFRGTPLLVQIVFWGYLGLLYQQISLGVPLTDIQFFSADTNDLIPALVGGVIALSLNEGAYAAEIVRAGLLSIDHGQREAAYSLGATETAMKERKDLIEDALAATRAAIEEGVVPGGGTALIRCAAALEDLKLSGDEKLGAHLIRNVLEIPLRTIAENAGMEGAVVANNVRKSKEKTYGYDALNDRYGDMFSFGIVDPTKVTRSALQNATSVASLLLTTESIVVEEPKKAEDTHHDDHHDMGGMGGMGGMGMPGMGGGMMSYRLAAASSLNSFSKSASISSFISSSIRIIC